MSTKHSAAATLATVTAIASNGAPLAFGGGSDHNGGMEYVPRPELDAKLETIESRMDGRIARIEDRFDRIDEKFNQIDERFSQIDERFSQVDKSLQSTRNAVWYAAAAVIATFIAVATMNISAFDSGRDTARLMAEAQARASQAHQETLRAQQETSRMQQETSRIAAEAQARASQAQQEIAASLTEIRQIVADIRAQNAAPPVRPSE